VFIWLLISVFISLSMPNMLHIHRHIHRLDDCSLTARALSFQLIPVNSNILHMYIIKTAER
jgi:hypothetical protein